MKALIFNSGIGKRLMPLTKDNPKCLVKLNGKTILGHELDNLLQYNIKDVVITLGPFEEKIKKFVKGNFPEIAADYVKNPEYKSTNYIYSMWLAKDIIDDDVIMMHGDMVFEKGLLGKLLNKEFKNCVLVNNRIEPPGKDFKGEIKKGLVRKISVSIPEKGNFFLAPIYKFSKNDFKRWVHEIKGFIEKGDLNVHAEEAFNNMPNQIKLHPVYFGDEFCMEIDNPGDLETARKFFRKQNVRPER